MRRPAMISALLLSFAPLLAACDGDSACVQWSETEGPCPSRTDALALIAPSCEDPIASIDSDGELDGDACCYEVTRAEGSTCE
ncbi:MAG: hypothetical protein WKG00_05320 [Polyangiaceae bacterium]